jgi:hypothetical protein
MVQAGPGIKRDHISKITNAKRAGADRVAQVGECLVSMHEALSSTTGTTKRLKTPF